MAAPKLPTQIRVGPIRYTVSDDKAAHDASCRDLQANLLGYSDHKNQIITLEATQAADCKADSLLHEALHCVTVFCGLSSEWGADKDEAFIQRLSPVLLGVLRDNPDFVAFLTGAS